MTHTQPESNQTPLATFPFYNKKGVPSYRILIKPIPEEAYQTEGGFQVPEGATKSVDTGRVVTSHPDCFIQPGDVVSYAIMPRGEGSAASTMDIDGETHHLLYETEIWMVNDYPVNRLFVQPVSDIGVSESGFVIPESAKGIVQYGIVRAAPLTSRYFKVGDVVSYRRNENMIYPETEINGERNHIIFEREVFTVNGAVSPTRIIVKINKIRQAEMQFVGESKFQVHENFAYMRHYLQWAKVEEMGEDAQKMYPEVSVGHYVAIHHTIEHQPNRLLSQKSNSQGIIVSERRVLNCYDDGAREIMGVLHTMQEKKLHLMGVSPVQENIFLDYTITPFEKTQKYDGFIGAEVIDLSDVADLEELLHVVEQAKKKGLERYTEEYNALIARLGMLSPENPLHTDEAHSIESKIEQLKRSAIKSAQSVNKNHLLVCKVDGRSMPKMREGVSMDIPTSHVLTYSGYLYPISLMGNKYMVAHKEYILAYLNIDKNTDQIMLHNTTPFADRVLIKPVKENAESASGFIRPAATTFETPQKATVVSVGPGTPSVPMTAQPGDIVMYNKMGTVELELEGEMYLLVRHNDLLVNLGKEAVPAV